MVTDKILESRRRASTWYTENKEKALARNKERRKDNRKVLLEAAQNRSRAKNIPIDITIDDIVIPEYCPALGIKLERGKGKFISASPSLDRINPALGYIKGNVQVISSKANAMKNDASKEHLLSFARWILNTYQEDCNGN